MGFRYTKALGARLDDVPKIILSVLGYIRMPNAGTLYFLLLVCFQDSLLQIFSERLSYGMGDIFMFQLSAGFLT
jgi:hypothetical protein